MSEVLRQRAEIRRQRSVDCTSGPSSVVCEEKAGDGEQETGIGSQGAGVGERETDVRGQRSAPPLTGWLFVICYS